MKAKMRTFELKINTAKMCVYRAPVSSVIISGPKGKEGFLSGHSDALKRLSAGPLEITEADGRRVSFVTGGGFCLARDHAMVIFTGEVATVSESAEP